MSTELPLIVGEDLIDRVEVVVGDITKQCVDVIVNAANESLVGGGGVDGAIHRAAGERLLAHNKTLGGCVTGSVVVTPSFDLEGVGIQKIIHAVGPVWHGDENQKLSNNAEDVFLASCYHWSLERVFECGFKSVAFPCISTGVYGFPKERAAKIAFGHVHGFLLSHALPEKVVFCCLDEADAKIYRDVISGRGNWMYSRRRV